MELLRSVRQDVHRDVTFLTLLPVIVSFVDVVVAVAAQTQPQEQVKASIIAVEPPLARLKQKPA